MSEQRAAIQQTEQQHNKTGDDEMPTENITARPTPDETEAALVVLRSIGERMEADQSIENIGWSDLTDLFDALVPIFGPLVDLPS